MRNDRLGDSIPHTPVGGGRNRSFHLGPDADHGRHGSRGAAELTDRRELKW